MESPALVCCKPQLTLLSWYSDAMGKRARQANRASRGGPSRLGVPPGRRSAPTGAPVENSPNYLLNEIASVPPPALSDWRDSLQAVEARRAALVVVEESIVRDALEAGVPLAEIARTLGISRQWAHRRFGHLRADPEV